MADFRSNRNVLFSCKYHVVFCPKYRKPVLNPPIDAKLKKLIQQVCDETQSPRQKRVHAHLRSARDPGAISLRVGPRSAEQRKKPCTASGTRDRRHFPSGFRIFNSSAWTYSLPQITLPLVSASSLPSMPETMPPASRTMICPAAISQACRLRSQ